MAKILLSHPPMKKLLFIALVLASTSLAHADYYPSPFALLGIANTWTAAQTFKDIIITGTCTGCGGGSGQNYPDWTISGIDNVNSTTSNSITVSGINVIG